MADQTATQPENLKCTEFDVMVFSTAWTLTLAFCVCAVLQISDWTGLDKDIESKIIIPLGIAAVLPMVAYVGMPLLGIACMPLLAIYTLFNMCTELWKEPKEEKKLLMNKKKRKKEDYYSFV